jgi:hypothetical protein
VSYPSTPCAAPIDSEQTAKELLHSEWPLKVRLIGLRMTKLKDLKAATEPAHGIKRVSRTFSAYLCPSINHLVVFRIC